MRRPRRFDCYQLPPVVADATTVRAQVADLDREIGTMRRPEYRGALYAHAVAAVEAARLASVDHFARMTAASSAAWVAAREAASRACASAWGEYADANIADVTERGLADRARCRAHAAE